MSIVIDTDDAKDKIFIDFAEDFRRTKRNVLFWASTTILIVLGTLGSDVPIETSWAQNIMLPPKLLTIGAWAVMAYMCVDFWHANHRLQIDNSTLKATIVHKGTVKASSELARTMRELKGQLDVVGPNAITRLREIDEDDFIVEIVEIESLLNDLDRTFSQAARLESVIQEFAGTVDQRDQAVRKHYYWRLTLLLVVAATLLSAFRIFGSESVRQWTAEAIYLAHAKDTPRVTNRLPEALAHDNSISGDSQQNLPAPMASSPSTSVR